MTAWFGASGAVGNKIAPCASRRAADTWEARPVARYAVRKTRLSQKRGFDPWRVRENGKKETQSRGYCQEASAGRSAAVKGPDLR